MRHRHPATRAVAAVALVTLLSGCSASASMQSGAALSLDPESSASPYTCTPIGSTPFPCTPEQYTETEKETVLADQAKQTYTRFQGEFSALLRAGGATTPSAELSALSGGPYLAAQLGTLTKMSQLQEKLVGGDITLTQLTPVAGAPARGYIVALHACVDSRTTTLNQGDKVLGKGQLVSEIAYFKLDGDTLKVWDAEKGGSC